MKREFKAQIKKDKARLKELRKLDKQNALSEEETWEYVRLLNENTERINKVTNKLYVVTFVIHGINFVILVGWLISILIR